MKASFDIRGHLQPHGAVEMTQEEFETFFVTQFGNAVRREIFEEYRRYTEDLRAIVNVPFVQWIGGSFVTNRDNPNDIDLVTVIDHEVYAVHEQAIDERFSKWAVGRFYQKIDAYTLWEYPEGHKYHSTFLADKLYWHDWFANSRFNRAGKRFPKGFIQLNIN